MKKPTAFFQSAVHDPWYNLALEEYLLQKIDAYEAIFYLWQNQNTVVIGKNQNAWKECNTTLLEQEDGKLARRSTGGGAVFHDLGNLNFTFVVKRADYDFERQAGVIIKALQALGLQAQITGRNDIVIDERKISGNAFLLRKQVALHHGTLLVDADMQKMGRYLTVSPEKMKAKGVESVKSRVVNLKALCPTLTIAQLQEALQTAFYAEYGEGEQLHIDASAPDVLAFTERYGSWAWRYGETPDFDVEYSTRFAWGDLTLQLQLQEGVVQQVTAYSDAMDADLIGAISQWLIGAPYQSEAFAKIFRAQKQAFPTGAQELEDIAVWICTHQF